jgi:hypothetical protein
MAASPFSGIHLARAKQVGEGVGPTLDAKVDVPRSVARIQEFLQHPCCEEAMRPGVAEAARLRGLTRRARKFPQLIFLCPTPAEANCVWHFYVDERFHVSAGSP